MEEKESTVSLSPENSESESPPPVRSFVVPPPHMNLDMNMNMSMERGLGGATTTPTTTTPPLLYPPQLTTTTTTAASEGGVLQGSGTGSVDLFGKKKRGRPRKYDADGNLRVPYKAAVPPVSPPSGFSLSPSSAPELASKRGRPPGSGNWQVLASLGELFASTAGGDFMPHVVTVCTGEDVAGNILSFAQRGPRGVCVLSANGTVSNVTIRQPGSSGGILTYEGRFEILSLSGSYTITDSSGVKSRTGGLSVSLAGPDGRVVGGGIAGSLIAASPIQVVLGSFMPNGYKAHKRRHHRENTMATTIPPGDTATAATAATPISQAKPDYASLINPTSLLPERRHVEADDKASDKLIPNMPTSYSSGWNGVEPLPSHRPSPDINVSLPSD
ncbi:DNA binding protein putative isoform 1 [Tripterygium wilfordii]|uniref:AT-hook motif nuclear-localized protein n=1 Tax=Tripterygium wilfordii TaxID=458696 RepID=A0A7J7CTY0_TRIWF|nr:AT-hook motif nuclear-localized protein 7-like [Tripterygium wilfordii]KAF5737494.1 DNA binding protein putative isoform 1 [Tripterygium wilfordii]